MYFLGSAMTHVRIDQVCHSNANGSAEGEMRDDGFHRHGFKDAPMFVKSIRNIG